LLVKEKWARLLTAMGRFDIVARVQRPEFMSLPSFSSETLRAPRPASAWWYWVSTEGATALA
jgi:hypothetical protein